MLGEPSSVRFFRIPGVDIIVYQASHILHFYLIMHTNVPVDYLLLVGRDSRKTVGLDASQCSMLFRSIKLQVTTPFCTVV